MPPPALIESVSEQVAASGSVSVQVIANFAWQHMKAATMFRDHAQELERKHAASAIGPQFEEIRAYASACLMSTAASLEALVNEYFIATNGKLRPMFADFEVDFWARGGVERKPILEKYQHALKLLGYAALDESSTIYQDTSALIELRNNLVHYKPTWDTDRTSKVSLIKYLNGKYPISPFLTASDDFITMQSMSYGCCNWAVGTAFKFIHDFDGRARLDDDKMKGFWLIES